MADVDEQPSSSRFHGLSTSLLDDIWVNALDPSYLQEAERRGGLAGGGGTRRRWLSGVLAAALVGGAVAVGVTQARLTRQEVSESRPVLLAQVHQQESTTDRLQRTADALSASVAAARARRLAMSGAGAAADQAVDQLESATAAEAVTGPGITVRVKDAAHATATSGRVTDRDLQSVVNALWAAGAEAIAVDGQRLGPSSAIRTAGEAILVDFRPVSSPYEVAAIGDQNGLQAGYAASTAADRLQALAGLEGIGVAVSTSGALHLPGTTTAAPSLATPVGPGTG